MYPRCKMSPQSSYFAIFPGSPKVFFSFFPTLDLLILFCSHFIRTTGITWVLLVNPGQYPHPRVFNLMPTGNFLCHVSGHILVFQGLGLGLGLMIPWGIIILPANCELGSHYSTYHSHLAKKYQPIKMLPSSEIQLHDVKNR